MAKLKVTNKANGKSFTADSADVRTLQANPVLKNAFIFEAEEAKPEEPKTTTKEDSKK